ncbi:Menaquinone reductase, iron-sulfur cluster-binding subunit [Fundidesulfovibrio magnetotacticus]|uniref:Menaquinone reductase, iron-sulfur cluster-binding subunit n=1 Tax=Fundidesulfovibrio magnetotacticus TaxID=2730080 RepID=A0A6V8LTH9_9BACT|nr:4Fe-4S dicluster domain-containing protein [Fundidesulfovibrio magnetotacticus]GFK95034.1 Menaquinone reductase, iron-sulfur cluster-binding subunit [Fundidesulfovibrio magnetotacticus]
MSAIEDRGFGLLVDLDRCTGCGACRTACALENNVPPSAGAEGEWLAVERLESVGKGEQLDVLFVPRPCMHCDAPPCVAACPTGATCKDPAWGVVSQVYARCIGCRLCMSACPYGARRFNAADPVWPGGMERAFTPWASSRPRFVVEKCTLCAHRIGAQGLLTACAEACPTGAIRSGVPGELLEGREAFVLRPGTGASPRVWYVSRRDWARDAG